MTLEESIDSAFTDKRIFCVFQLMIGSCCKISYFCYCKRIPSWIYFKYSALQHQLMIVNLLPWICLSFRCTFFLDWWGKLLCLQLPNMLELARLLVWVMWRRYWHQRDTGSKDRAPGDECNLHRMRNGRGRRTLFEHIKLANDQEGVDQSEQVRRIFDEKKMTLASLQRMNIAFIDCQRGHLLLAQQFLTFSLVLVPSLCS